jgi:hypothetical protein
MKESGDFKNSGGMLTQDKVGKTASIHFWLK